MRSAKELLVRRCRPVTVTGIISSLGLCLLASLAAQSHAEDYLNLPAVKPVMTCDRLAKADLNKVVGAATTINSAVVADTEKGQFCRVTGTIDPSTIFQVDLPLEHWTQRFIENPVNAVAIGYAGSCAPALNGEFAVAFDNQGHSGSGLMDSSWTPDMQLRIDFAYRANHVTALAAKALIRIFYGQPQRFSYFVGCSEGGREALTEAERFPEDFDGVVAGSPLILDSAHNAFFQPWESFVNKRADGSRILASSRLGILHQAVLEHCAAASGVLDGVLLEPTACKFDPSWVQCKAGAADNSKCLTAEEVGVVEKLYKGPGDGTGHYFDLSGFALGSENHWRLSTANQTGNRKTESGSQIRRLLAPPEGNKSATDLEDAFDFTQEWFDKTLTLAPLYNAGNTNLGLFEEHGGKLILWNGAEDATIQPEMAVAYYQGVQKVLGDKMTDSFLRLFMVPGFGHCFGSDIPFQLDLLSPIMAWTELHRAPEKIVISKAAASQPGPGGPGNSGGTGNQNATVKAGVQPAPPSILGPPGGPWSAHYPLALPNLPSVFTRPVYPFPYIARYSGKGDPNDAASYEPVKSGARTPQVFDTEAFKLLGPNNQKFYHVENGQLVPDVK